MAKNADAGELLAKLNAQARAVGYESAEALVDFIAGETTVSTQAAELVHLRSLVAGLQQKLAAETARADNAVRVSNLVQDKLAAAMRAHVAGN